MEPLELLRRQIATLLEERVRPLLPPLGDYKITFIARVSSNPEADVVVTQDSLEGLERVLARRFEVSSQ
jgi:hypothetical protein